MSSQIPFHQGFSMYILLLNKKENTRRVWKEGFVVCAVKHNGEVWALDTKSNTGAVFAPDKTLMRGICTDGAAVSFVKPEAMSSAEQARLMGLFPKKL